MSRKLFGIGLVLCVLMAVARAQTDSAPDYDYEDGLDEVDELDEEPMIKRCGTTECTTSTQTYGGSTDSTQPNGGTTDSTQTYGGSTNADKPKKKKKKFKGIDFSKARGHSYVRFVLASSVGFPNTNTTPMVIDTQECMSGTWTHNLNDPAAVDADYKTHPLRLYKLVGAEGARNCQSYYMHSAGGGNWNTKRKGGYPFSVTIANDTKSTIGWDMDGTTGMISWTAVSDYDRLKGQLTADCKSWWKNYDGKVRYYGRKCLLKIPSTASANLCVAAPADGDTNQAIVSMPCTRSEKRQIWHLQSTATEYPDYFGDCGQNCWGKRYNKDPIRFYQVTGKYLNTTTDMPPGESGTTSQSGTTGTSGTTSDLNTSLDGDSSSGMLGSGSGDSGQVGSGGTQYNSGNGDSTGGGSGGDGGSGGSGESGGTGGNGGNGGDGGNGGSGGTGTGSV